MRLKGLLLSFQRPLHADFAPALRNLAGVHGVLCGRGVFPTGSLHADDRHVKRL